MVFQRVVFVSFAILIQLLFLILMVFFFDTVWRWFSIAMSILSFLAVLYILSDRTNPSYKLAWVIPILAFPNFGGILYIMIGGNKLLRLRRELFSRDAAGAAPGRALYFHRILHH